MVDIVSYELVGNGLNDADRVLGGPAFFNYFYGQNELISNGTNEGVELHMNSLGIINGIIDERIQGKLEILRGLYALTPSSILLS
jgi:hypothetical protein